MEEEATAWTGVWYKESRFNSGGIQRLEEEEEEEAI